jgi:hypothetical protein
MNARTAISTILPAGQLFAHESGKNRFNDALTQLIADKDMWKLHDALIFLMEKGQLEQANEPLQIELTREPRKSCRFSNLQIAETLLVLGRCVKVVRSARVQAIPRRRPLPPRH